jgi:tetratricopeptide (TPR) repeat protein
MSSPTMYLPLVQLSLAACLAWAATAVASENVSQPVATALPNGVQAYSLLGKALVAPAPDLVTLDKLKAARMHYEQDSSDADNIIWYGRRLAYAGDYREAIRLFTEGIARHPEDARMYRHRGHRYISLREFDNAIEDLERAAALVEGKEDRIEPDGLPNALNIPVSTLHGNIWYHLGLAYYLKQDWESAYRAFQAGFELGTNADNAVSTTHWRYMILRRMGETVRANDVLAEVSEEMNVIENAVYHRLCLFYKGEISLQEIMGEDTDNPTGAAAAYGVANWFYYSGDEAEAEKRLLELLHSDEWASFGFIAAEADLASRVKDSS